VPVAASEPRQETHGVDHFDQAIISHLNHFARQSFVFDTFVAVALGNPLVKAGVIVACLWWLWFQPGDGEQQRREQLLSGIVSCGLALLLGRLLQLALPFRSRPLHDAALHFRVPFGVVPEGLRGWSSFPSDHAVLLFALATTVFLTSRRVGVLAYGHALCVGCLPRVYLGYHYPTDIIAGALLGTLVCALSAVGAIRKTLAQPGLRWLDRHPASFYTCGFLATSQMAVLFDPLRELYGFVVTTARLPW
jgi:undecaprenyl-diphosphatase